MFLLVVVTSKLDFCILLLLLDLSNNKVSTVVLFGEVNREVVISWRDSTVL